MGYADGFAQGAAEMVWLTAFHEDASFGSSLSDPAWGAEQALKMEQRGADVLFAYGGSTGLSALEAATGRVIGVEVDVARKMPGMRDRVVASIVFDLSVLKEVFLQNVLNGDMQAGYSVAWGEAMPAGLRDDFDVLFAQNLYDK